MSAAIEPICPIIMPMKMLFDVLPFVLFFVTAKVWNLIVATAVAMAVSALQIAYIHFSGRKVETMQWVSLALIGIFGTMTLVMNDPIFIMWRSSIVNWLLAAVLLGSLLVLKKSLLKSLMGSKITMPDFAWRAMTWGMIALFTVMGVLNIVVAKNFSESFWLNYKTFGSPAITFVFFMLMMMALSRYMTLPDDANAANSKGKSDQ